MITPHISFFNFSSRFEVWLLTQRIFIVTINIRFHKTRSRLLGSLESLLDFTRLNNSLAGSSILLLLQCFAAGSTFRFRQPYFIKGRGPVDQNPILIIFILDIRLPAGNKQFGTNGIELGRRLSIAEHGLKLVIENNMILRADITSV
jgi:hypothetical protein